MSDWSWEVRPGLSGSGKLVNFGGLFSPDLVEKLRFTVKGKLASGVKVSELVEDIMEKELEVEVVKVTNRYLPISVLELVLRALWRVKVRKLKYAIMNDRHLTQDNYFYELCERVNSGEKVNQLGAVVENKRQKVELRFKFRNKNVTGEIVFAKPMKERVVEKFTRQLDDLVPMLKKEKLPFRRGRKFSIFEILFQKQRVRYGYGFYRLPSGYHLDSSGIYDFSPGGAGGGGYGGSGSSSSGSGFNVTKKE